MTFLEASGIYSGYGETEILHGVSLRVDAGEFVSIIGPNGAGKSTLVKTIIGLLKPRKGRIMFDGHEITGLGPEQLVPRGLAYVPQTDNTFPSLSVRENLEMGAITRRPGWLGTVSHRIGQHVRPILGRILKLPEQVRAARHDFTEDEFAKRLDEICTIFPNLRPKLDVRVSTMSGGEQQMVALAKTLVLDPTALLVDEPSAGLAPRLVQMVFQKLEAINRRGVAIVLVEQNARKALAIADRGYVLEAGKNRYEGLGQALLTDPDVGRLYLGG